MKTRSLLPVVMALAAAELHADTITGRVADPNGVGIVGVTLEFSGITPLNPITGLNGVFTITVPAGTYDIAFLPGTSAFAPRELAGIAVAGTTNIGTVVLQPGHLLSGVVIDRNGLPVVGGDTNVYDQASGEKLFTPSDNTDPLGVFQVVVPAGTYRLRVRPAPGVLLVAEERENIAVAGPTSVGSITLEPGVAVTGTVVDATSLAPLPDIDLSAEFARGGGKIVTPDDETDGNGRFALVLPVGLLNLTINPPATSTHVAQEHFNVSIGGTVDLGTFALKRGWVLSGKVTDLGAAPVADADIDVDTAVGAVRVYTPHDSTDAGGNFRVVVPGGSFRITVEPRPSALLVGARTAAVTVAANTTVAPIALGPGVVLSGTITAFDGTPEADADLDLLDPATGEEVITPGDDTDAGGHYSVVAPAGTWDIAIQTAKASQSRDETVKGVAVAGPTAFSRQLTRVPVWGFLGTVGVPTLPPGGPVFGLLAVWNPNASATPTAASIVLIDPAGAETPLLPPIPLTIPAGLVSIAAVAFPLPAPNPAHLGLPFRLELRFDDPITKREQDHDSFRFIVQ